MICTGDVLHNPVTGERLRFVKTSRDTGGESIELEVTVEPHGAVAAAHLHPSQTERFEIVSGTVGFRVAGKTIEAQAGDVVLVEPGTAHKFWNAGEDEAVFRTEIFPALELREPDRDDVRARRRRQDEPQGHAEPAPARGDREGALRRRAAPLPARLDAARRASRSARRSAACSATARPTSPPAARSAWPPPNVTRMTTMTKTEAPTMTNENGNGAHLKAVEGSAPPGSRRGSASSRHASTRCGARASCSACRSRTVAATSTPAGSSAGTARRCRLSRRSCASPGTEASATRGCTASSGCGAGLTGAPAGRGRAARRQRRARAAGARGGRVADTGQSWTTSSSPSSSTEPPSARTTRPATAAPRSRRSSPSTIGPAFSGTGESVKRAPATTTADPRDAAVADDAARELRERARDRLGLGLDRRPGSRRPRPRRPRPVRRPRARARACPPRAAPARSGRSRSARRARGRRGAPRADRRPPRSCRRKRAVRLVVLVHARQRLGEAVHGRERRAQVVARERDETRERRILRRPHGGHPEPSHTGPPGLRAGRAARALAGRRAGVEHGDPAPAPRRRAARRRRDRLHRRPRAGSEGRPHVALPRALRGGDRGGRDRRGAARRGARRAHRDAHRRPAGRAPRGGPHRRALPARAPHAGDRARDAGDGLADRDRGRERARGAAGRRRRGDRDQRVPVRAGARPRPGRRAAARGRLRRRATSSASSSSSRSRPTTSAAAGRSSSARPSRSTPRRSSRSSSAR